MAGASRLTVSGLGYESRVALRTILPLESAPDATVELPGSKSIVNRVLLLAALARGTSELSRVLVAEDTLAMLDCVRAIGATVVMEAADLASVTGVAGRPSASGKAFARGSGTTARFLAPALSLTEGPWELDGDAQLRGRPMADLFEALRGLGVRVVERGAPGALPVELSGPIRAGRCAISGAVSSQFLSGLLLAAPLLPLGLELEVTDALVSRPYVEMTLATMRRFGATVEVSDRRFSVRPGGYEAAAVDIEPDASAASYFFAAAVLTHGTVRVPGLGEHSIQGDVAFVEVLAAMGAAVERTEDAIVVSGAGRTLHGIDVDLADFSDTVPTLAVVAALAEGPTRIRGVGFIRNKESNRIAAVVAELGRLGIGAVEEPDGLVIEPGRPSGGVVRTYGDHRIAMAFSLLGLVTPGVEIDDPECVAKTFPEFFSVLETLRTAPG